MISDSGQDEGKVDFWDIFDALLGPLNVIDRLEGVVSAIRYGDYRSARKYGPLGVAAEATRSVMGVNSARFALARSGEHTLSDVEKLLRLYGIPIFGRTHDAQNMYFSVKKRQARWAEYILLNAGVKLASPTFDQRNPGYVGRHGPGWMPTPWAEKEGPPAKGSAPSALHAPPADQARPLDRINRWLDDLLTF